MNICAEIIAFNPIYMLLTVKLFHSIFLYSLLSYFLYFVAWSPVHLAKDQHIFWSSKEFNCLEIFAFSRFSTNMQWLSLISKFQFRIKVGVPQFWLISSLRWTFFHLLKIFSESVLCFDSLCLTYISGDHKQKEYRDLLLQRNRKTSKDRIWSIKCRERG